MISNYINSNSQNTKLAINSHSKNTKSILHHFYLSTPVSLTLCPMWFLSMGSRRLHSMQ